MPGLPSYLVQELNVGTAGWLGFTLIGQYLPPQGQTIRSSLIHSPSCSIEVVSMFRGSRRFMCCTGALPGVRRIQSVAKWAKYLLMERSARGGHSLCYAGNYLHMWTWKSIRNPRCLKKNWSTWVLFADFAPPRLELTHFHLARTYPGNYQHNSLK